MYSYKFDNSLRFGNLVLDVLYVHLLTVYLFRKSIFNLYCNTIRTSAAEISFLNVKIDRCESNIFEFTNRYKSIVT